MCVCVCIYMNITIVVCVVLLGVGRHEQRMYDNCQSFRFLGRIVGFVNNDEILERIDSSLLRIKVHKKISETNVKAIRFSNEVTTKKCTLHVA